MYNLANILETSTKKYPNTTALICGNAELSYSDLNKKCNQLANALVNFGIKPGDKVAFSSPNVPNFQVLYYGILKVGAVAVPISTMLKANEIEHQLTNTNSKAFFCYSSLPGLPIADFGMEGYSRVDSCTLFVLIDALETPINIQNLEEFVKDQSDSFETHNTLETDTAVIIHTSGTTGVQKGAELSHSNLTMNAMVSTNQNVANINHGDRLLAALPLFHVFGQTVMMNSGILSGATLVLMPRFDPVQAFELMERECITVFSGVPTMFWAMLNVKADNFRMDKISSTLHTCISGGDSLPVEIYNEFKSKFNIQITEGYGMTEGSPVVTINHRNIGIKPGSIGTPLWGIEVKIVDDSNNELPKGEIGELIFKGFNVMKGYYNNPEGTSEAIINGWMHSGDLAQIDEDGYIYIVGRIKEMIIRSGLNVYPKEVEMALMKHHAVSMVSVIGIPDKIKGEEVKAYTVLKPNFSTTPKEIKGWINQQIASYKCPRQIEIVETLPTNATGKIMKRFLKDGHWYDKN